MMIISTHDDLVAFYGSTTKTAAIFGVTSPAVSHWRCRGIPTGFHLRIFLDVKDRGGDISPELFGMPDEFGARFEKLTTAHAQKMPPGGLKPGGI